ncbi:unnamed protein product [Nyctereutes procyonoides]|uniref:(raccoon dog) hypothetical protein n=1 Tax=Nyctereutes procyonoides TaxID=34880 RepID=A0A811Y2R3_NYCPR|nr:unnamed protein product [Nyctereutes procyonoides]
MEPSVSSTSDISVKSSDKVCHPQISEQLMFCPKHRCCSIPILLLSASLPPVNKVYWDTLQNCLQKHAYSEINQECGDNVKMIPETSPEAKLQSCLRKCKMVAKKARIWKSCKSEREGGLNTVKSQSIQLNSPSIPASVETFLLQASRVRWCVIHGRPLLADTQDWVRLQFHVGQAWVPDIPKR